MTTDQLRSLLTADPSAVLESDRRFYFKQIAQAAELIAANARQRPVVLLAGPSGSGKTTTALLIERELDRKGMETHTLCMDDYFLPLTEREIELLHRNELDLEKPTRVDIPFFQQQLSQILDGQEIELPRYDFKTSRRVFDGRTLRRKPGELIIMKGIHALNPDVTGHADSTTRIYVSVRTRITAQDGSVKNSGRHGLDLEQIAHMDWLCDAVDGHIPEYDELAEVSKPMYRMQGIHRDLLPVEKEAEL